ncbi:hypothetical protein PCANC_13732 [Puccinia coronata f. sp. avenae]|uniref:Uncharacterized protein n=1 Tax=Puccinia coronata f. sp. avenae TaxID=200324 RepID=A0A2N5VFQ6_9BASI|nr:hypothetical protein PCANC_16155 [Puccinia coronata f. sp. avenae]PLW48828.1 hypothetical protein PCANC_13732 [Puccinia coronata f. sp. avenae]
MLPPPLGPKRVAPDGWEGATTGKVGGEYSVAGDASTHPVPVSSGTPRVLRTAGSLLPAAAPPWTSVPSPLRPSGNLAIES